MKMLRWTWAEHPEGPWTLYCYNEQADHGYADFDYFNYQINH